MYENDVEWCRYAIEVEHDVVSNWCQRVLVVVSLSDSSHRRRRSPKWCHLQQQNQQQQQSANIIEQTRNPFRCLVSLSHFPALLIISIQTPQTINTSLCFLNCTVAATKCCFDGNTVTIDSAQRLATHEIAWKSMKNRTAVFDLQWKVDTLLCQSTIC